MGFLDFYSAMFNPNKSFLAFGPKFIPSNWVINLHKGATIFLIYFMMWYYQNFSIGCYIYMAIHGSYGNLIQ